MAPNPVNSDHLTGTYNTEADGTAPVPPRWAEDHDCLPLTRAHVSPRLSLGEEGNCGSAMVSPRWAEADERLPAPEQQIFDSLPATVHRRGEIGATMVSPRWAEGYDMFPKQQAFISPSPSPPGPGSAAVHSREMDFENIVVPAPLKVNERQKPTGMGMRPVPGGASEQELHKKGKSKWKTVLGRLFCQG